MDIGLKPLSRPEAHGSTVGEIHVYGPRRHNFVTILLHLLALQLRRADIRYACTVESVSRKIRIHRLPWRRRRRSQPSKRRHSKRFSVQGQLCFDLYCKPKAGNTLNHRVQLGEVDKALLDEEISPLIL